MLDKIPNFITDITINTGNIISKCDLSRHIGQNLDEELLDALSIILNSWTDVETFVGQNQSHLMISNNDEESCLNELTSFNRCDLKISIKVFLLDDQNRYNDCIIDSVHQVLKTVQVNTIDTLTLDFGKNFVKIDESFQKGWSAIEKLVLEKKVNRIGLSNIDEYLFQEIFEWAFIKPNFIQINANSCCQILPWFNDFCKKNDIQLLTHSDSDSSLQCQSINKLLFDNLFKIKWILRYQIHIKCRGVVTTKGYLVKLSK